MKNCLCSDVQVVDEVMLEDINNILNASDVPNLYAPEDLDAIMSACRWDDVLAVAEETSHGGVAWYIFCSFAPP